MFLILRPTIKHTILRNDTIAEENQRLEQANEELKIQSANLEKKTEEIRQQAIDAKWEYNTLRARRDEVKTSLDDLEQQSADAAQKLYKAAREAAQVSFDKEIEDMSKALDEEREKIQLIYLDTTKDCVATFQKEIDEKSYELAQATIQLNNLKRNVDVAVKEAKRHLEMENKKDFYRLVLSDDDIVEIKRLREVLPYLRDKTPLNKVIYKVYYEKPLTDMIGRVVGTGIHTGIYKITHIDSQKCYVGQAVNIADRWKQHCKRGVGAEDWTRNKLYPAMYSLGVENFSFEILEECDRSKLNEKEDYWQEFFHAKDFGYSIK